MKQLFLTSSSDYVMADIVTKLKNSPKNMNLAFITTASEVEKGDLWWVRSEKEALLKAGFQIEDFTITGMAGIEIEKKLDNKQVIYLTGGNTFYLLDQLIKTGCDKIIKRKIAEGVIYIGSSAGSMVAGTRIDLVTSIDDKSKAPGLKSTGMGIIDLAILPHWGSVEFKKEYLQGFESMYVEEVKIVPLTNYQYIWVKDNATQIVQVEH